MEKGGEKRDLEYFRYHMEKGKFSMWKRIHHPIRTFRNFMVLSMARFMPDMRFRYTLYRRLGTRIGKDVRMYGVKMDIFFPGLIEIGDGTLIGQDTMLVTHEFLNDHWKRGKIKIGKNVTIGALCLILPGVEIGDGATIAAYSLVNRNVPEGAFVGGVPAKEIRNGRRKAFG